MISYIDRNPNNGERMRNLVNRLSAEAEVEEKKKHPFAELTALKDAQHAFERAANSDWSLTQDSMHLLPECAVSSFTPEVIKMLSEYDAIISDSCTCSTAPHEEFWWDKYKNSQDYEGKNFKEAVEQCNPNCRYIPCWGKGLAWMEWHVQELSLIHISEPTRPY